MTAEGSGAMMVLPVHVVCERAAERNKPRPWRGRQEPAARNGEGEQRRKRKAGLRAQDPGCIIEGHETVEAAHVDRFAVAVDAGITVRPTQTAGKKARLAGASHQVR